MDRGGGGTLFAVQSWRSGRSAGEGPRQLFVTRPALPPLEELLPLLEQIWSSRMLTNGGPMQQRFETALADHLGVPNVSTVANATLGLVLALVQHGVQCHEVITTPFSFIATGHSVLWAGATPVFADIERRTLGLDPEAVERAITPRTKAILAVHCYGFACDVVGLGQVADRHGIPLIYDAAHAFGVRIRGQSLLAHGHTSVLSFHATKVFNTFEGGAVVSRSSAAKLEMDRLINYGIVDDVHVDSVGMNAKASEFTAALGLVQLGHVGEYLERRRRVDKRYRELLDGIPGLVCLAPPAEQEHNYYNFPILVDPGFGLSRDQLFAELRARGVHARRYFFPLIGHFPMYRQFPTADPARTPLAAEIAERVLCLPMFPDLEEQEQIGIAETIRAAFARAAI